VDLAERLPRRLLRERAQRNIGLLGFRVHQHRVALIERSALRVLPGQAERRSFGQERGKGQCFGKSVIDGALAGSHLRALLQKL